MTEVEIEYCVPCGYLDRALNLQRAVLSNFGQSVDRATLVAGDHGVLQVRVDSAARSAAGRSSGRRGGDTASNETAEPSRGPREDGDVVWDTADDEYDVDEVVRRVKAAL